MINLNEFGWNLEYAEEVKQNLIPARVIEVHRELYKVICEHGEINARLKGTFYKEIEFDDDIPVVGDFVYLLYNQYGDSLIAKLCKRKSKFSRTDFSGHAVGYVKTIHEQVIAANFDYVFIVVSLNHDFNMNRIERYIGAAIQSGAEPVIILTKADLNSDYEKYVQELKIQYNDIDVIAISSKTGFGLDILEKYLNKGKTLVFLGSSGVGKSSLVNAIAGEEIMKVNDIRESDSKGRHTTTHRQLIMLSSKTMIIDTPGMRELGMWDAEEGIKKTYSDIDELIKQCRFSDCSHVSEPGCAVKEAIKSGELDEDRWKRYLQLSKENRFGKQKSAYTKREKLVKKMKKR
ncbi:ribosome small subunit-dependent GTPase A [Sedimentibacter sp. zth1]|uniref:ribosome small subunit-dependent GTPase A n=1 Tax=Sedimentibacter sp. zth1 TaxID=2816908 RepID=UPI001A927303|nr:ribosome small subunit-dependent GTPase A [Sedimentibacter sp. zth1]QSX06278.1 ribosome small subunit-dependent GTPase A [Sedimentibacter sp. zth1]